MNSELKFGYHVCPPYIDAYENSFFNNEYKTISEIKDIAESYALDWGDSILNHEYNDNYPIYDGYIVLSMVHVYPLEYDKKSKTYLYGEAKNYVIILDVEESEDGYNIENWFNKLKFIEHESSFPESWDVT